MSDLEHNKQLVRDFFGRLSAFDIEGFKQLLTDDVVFNVPNTGCTGGKLDLPGFLQVMAGLGQICPAGVTTKILDLTAEDDRVSCRMEGSGKLVDGGEYLNQYHFLMRIRDGRICETYEYFDSLLVEKVFGPFMKQA